MGFGAPLPLGGFKILDEVLWAPLAESDPDCSPGTELCRLLSLHGINLPFLSFDRLGHQGFWNIILGAEDGARSLDINTTHLVYGGRAPLEGAVLSIFPHRNDPAVAGRLIQAFAGPVLWPYSLAYSPSALSVVLPAAAVPRATEAIFGPFCFGAYRTPADWRLAQQGKEALFKEVVASFQETRPKVYGLRWTNALRLFRLNLDREAMPVAGRILENLASTGHPLHFLMSSLVDSEGTTRLLMAAPEDAEIAWSAAIGRHVGEGLRATSRPVALFTMNGPHFGDRYGITSTLLQGLQQAGVRLLALNCSVASITGLVATEQAEEMIAAVSACFEVPAVIQIH